MKYRIFYLPVLVFFISCFLLSGCEKDSLFTEDEILETADLPTGITALEFYANANAEEIKQAVIGRFSIWPDDFDERTNLISQLIDESLVAEHSKQNLNTKSCPVTIIRDDGVQYFNREIRGELCESSYPDRIVATVLVTTTDQSGAFFSNFDYDIFDASRRTTRVDTYIDNLSGPYSNLSNSIARVQAQVGFSSVVGNTVQGPIYQESLVPTNISGTNVNSYECSSVMFAEEYVDIFSKLTFRNRNPGDGIIYFEASMFAGCDDD